MTVRTRFAPSPTGLLHVGGVRTALFSWLYAKHHNGAFFLRIEDTDSQRSSQASVEVILEGMNWMGLSYDKEPVYQTQRYDRYKKIAQQLLDTDLAYRCECSKERLETLREQQINAKEKPRYDGRCRDKHLSEDTTPQVIRFCNPRSGSVSFKDEVYGDIEVQNTELDDLIIVRSDGHPTYNFAVVVDDWDMNITHVIRGDDHISNTPRQINIFKALGATVPVFAHLPMILGEDGKRLSKRHGAVSVLEFKNMGIVPQALLNYLVRLGWSCGDQEIFSLSDMIEKFDLKNVSKGVASFNYDKLFWLNQHYLKTEITPVTIQELQYQFDRAEVNYLEGPPLKHLLEIQADRCKTLAEMVEKSLYFYNKDIDYNPAAVKKHLRPVVLEPLIGVAKSLLALDKWEALAIQKVVSDVCEAQGISMPKVAQPLRVAVTGDAMSPSIEITLELIGRERSLRRLEDAIHLIKKRIEDTLG